MTAQDVEKCLKEELGDWASKRKLKKYLGCGDVYLGKLLSSCSYRIQGRAKLYFTKDVAKAISLHTVRRPI